jgi:hypothetical protein
VVLSDGDGTHVLFAQVAAPKPKTEDGIFGTSGGIGFTKENELFVGRVAMIGFAVSTSQPRPCFSHACFVA